MSSAEEAEHGDGIFGPIGPHRGDPILKREDAAAEHDLNHAGQVKLSV